MRDQQIDCALLDALCHFSLALAELVARVELDGDAALGSFSDQVGELLRPDHIRMVHRQRRGQPHGGLVLGRCRPDP